jgi:hypothetical protein
MKKQSPKNMKNISAFLDGEADDAADVQAMIDQDPALAEEFAAMEKLSKAMAAMEDPEVDGAFRTRVMAAVRESEMATPARPLWAWGTAGAIAAVAMLVTAVTWQQPVLEDPSATVEAPSNLTAVDLDALSSAIEAQLAEAPSWETQDYMLGYEEALPPLDAIEQNEETIIYDQLAAALEETGELDELVDSMGQEESTRFKVLFANYATEG